MSVLEELSARWARSRALMVAHDLDLIVALDLSRDEVMLSYQRWLTGYTPIGMPAAVLVPREGPVELIGPMLGAAAADYYAFEQIPIELTTGFSIALLAERIARRAPRRIGIVETFAFPAALAQAVTDLPFSPVIVDLSAGMLKLRLRKSDAEIALIRQSCAIADKVWTQVADVFRVGRKTYEVLADVDHLVRQEGAEAGFHLILPLPFNGMPLRVLAEPTLIEADRRYIMEISPRFEGYYSQLTIPVTSFIDDTAAHRGHEALVAVKAMAGALMVPGADLMDIAHRTANFLEQRGYSMMSTSLGHFCGMGLEEPRHAPDLPFILEEGMTMIFHPVLAEPAFRSLMRGETYLITANGAEKLNKYEGGVLEVR